MKVYVHIDRLVLEGVATGYLSSNLLADSIQMEFAARIAAQGLPSRLKSPSAVPYASGATREALQGRPAERLGAGIGGALYGSLNR